MEHILLVEDTDIYRSLVITSLSDSYRVEVAQTIAEAVQKIQQKDFDLILLDIDLPDGSGFEFCTEIKNSSRTKDVPIIFLTGKLEVVHLVMGFSLGGDDYMTKPFDPQELKARVKMRIKKHTETKSKNTVIRKGKIELDLNSQQVSLILSDEQTPKVLELSPIEFKLLHYFINHEDHVLSRDQLITAVRGSAVVVADRTVDKHISSLRKKLETEAVSIQTVTGSGYVFSTKKAVKFSA